MPRRDSVAHAKYTELPEAGLSWVKSLGCLLLGYVPHKQGASLDLPQRRCQAVVSRQVVEIRARRFRVLRSHLRDRRQEGFDAPIRDFHFACPGWYLYTLESRRSHETFFVAQSSSSGGRHLSPR